MVAGRLPRRPACSVLCAPIAVTDPVRCFPAACRLQRVCAGHAAGRGGFSALAVLRKCDRKAPGTVLTPWITHVCFRFLSGSPAPTLNIEFIVEQTNGHFCLEASCELNPSEPRAKEYVSGKSVLAACAIARTKYPAPVSKRKKD
ncbi:mitochondrial inner membrane protease subunit 1 isoform X3 [Fukomys damarensis]|uniref:mitochondrial inner membrane protease subunit 1 isoform X3 n=1 Tax=Fukomys damarensis TaxID=885580 RepID=UPI00053F4882|nr:mitochondrial inner membrane protease subunit 1 isoform X3 [Fukomys damarensis]